MAASLVYYLVTHMDHLAYAI